MLTKDHATDLATKHAVPTAYAEAEGIMSVFTVSDLPDGYDEFGWKLPGLLFRHTEPTEDCSGWRTECQLRTDDRSDPSKKYLQRKGSGTVRSMDTIAQERFTAGTHTRVWWIEGTQQYRSVAAVIAFMNGAKDDPFADVLCIGMQGCWGWAIEAGIFPAWAKAAMKGRDVTVLFDADIATNYNVWTAAEAFMRGVKIAQAGAGTVTIAAGAGTGKAGIDDNLAHTLSMEDRAGELGIIMAEARVKLPPKPAKPRERASAAKTAMAAADRPGAVSVKAPEVDRKASGVVYEPNTKWLSPRLEKGADVLYALEAMGWHQVVDGVGETGEIGSGWAPIGTPDAVATERTEWVSNGFDSTVPVSTLLVNPRLAPAHWRLGDGFEEVQLTVMDLFTVHWLEGRHDLSEALFDHFGGDTTALLDWMADVMIDAGGQWVAEAAKLTGLPATPLGPLATAVAKGLGMRGAVRVFGDPGVELYISFGGSQHPEQTGTWRIEEAIEYKDGQQSTVRRPVKTNDWAAWPFARSEVRNHPEETLYDVIVVKGSSWKILRDVPADEVDDPEKIKRRDYKQLGLHVPKNRSGAPFADLAACLETAGISEMKVFPRLDEFGWHMIGDEAGWSSSNGTVFHDRIDTDIRTRLIADLPGSRGIGFSALPTDPRAVFASVKAFIGLSPEHPEMMVALLGTAFAPYGHPTAAGMTYVYGEPDSLKTRGIMACNAFGSGNPRALHASLKTSSSKGVQALMGKAQDTPLYFDDFRQGAGGSTEASKAFERSAGGGYGDADELKATRDGNLQDRKLATGTSVIASGEHSVDGNAAMDGRTLAFGPSLQSDPWIDGDLYDEFMDNLTEDARGVGALVLQNVARQVQEGGDLAPDATLESLRETSDAWLSRKLRETRKDHKRASETSAKPAFGWYLIRLAARAAGAEDLLPTEEFIEKQLKEILIATSKKNVAGSNPEACKEAIVDAVLTGTGYLTAIGKATPSTLLPRSVMANAGWRLSDRFDSWETGHRAEWAGVITPDRMGVWVSSSWTKDVVRARFETIAPSAISTAMMGWVPDGIDMGEWKPGKGAPTIPTSMRVGPVHGYLVPSSWFNLEPGAEPKDEHSVGKGNGFTANVVLPRPDEGFAWVLAPINTGCNLAAREAQRPWCRCTERTICDPCFDDLLAETATLPDAA